MKKAVLIVFAIAIILIIGGFGIVVATGLPVLTNLDKSDNVYYDTPVNISKEVTASECEHIDLSLVNSKVAVKSYDGKTIKLSYDENYKNQWDFSFSGSTLKLHYHQYWFGDLFGFIKMMRSGDFDIKSNIILLVPTDSSFSYDINEVNDSTEIDGIIASQLTLKGVNTSVIVTELTSQNEIKLNNVNGSFKFKDVKAPSVKFSGMVNSGFDAAGCSLGNIKADGFVNGHLTMDNFVKSDYNVKYSLVNGHVSYDDSTFNGSGRLGGDSAKYTLDFHGVNSDLNLNTELQ